MKIIDLKNKLGELIIPKKWEPVGTIKMFDREQDMSKMYYGTWELTLKERSPIGVNPDSTEDRFKTAGQQFGEKEHTLTIDEIPSHYHSKLLSIDDKPVVSYSTGNDTCYNISNTLNTSSGANINNFKTNSIGGGQPHNNIHPVETVYFYKRIA